MLTITPQQTKKPQQPQRVKAADGTVTIYLGEISFKLTNK